MKTLVYNDLLSNGRLCNQLFFIASCYGIAKRHGRQLSIPDWPYKQYFEWTNDIMTGSYPWIKPIQEPYFHYCEGDMSAQISSYKSAVAIKGFFQSERYFKQYETEIRQMFRWKSEFKERVKSSAGAIFDRPVVALHIRRGDYINNHNYHNLPPIYYTLSLEKFFPGWTTSCNVLVFSDDINWCKTQLAGNNIYYSEGRSDIEDLCLLSQCQHFILSNSTFSWWGAWLANTTDRIIRPTQMFEGELRIRHNITSDFWPDRWTPFNYEHQRIPAKDVTFLIPVYYDSQDREDNLVRAVQFIKRNFDTNIIIGEQKSSRFSTGSGYVYMGFQDMRYFHRTKMLNDMAKKASTPILVNYDADVIVPAIQLLQAIRLCREGIGMVLPYDGRFVRIPKDKHNLDIGLLDTADMYGGRATDKKSVGGCVLYRKDSFIKCGMENENFISYGPEDEERVVRFGRTGSDVRRIRGCLFHYDHAIFSDSSPANPFWERNCNELTKIRTLTNTKLKQYIQTWPWIKN